MVESTKPTLLSISPDIKDSTSAWEKMKLKSDSLKGIISIIHEIINKTD